MSFSKVAELANEFVIKIAEYQYEDQAPADVKNSEFCADDISDLDAKIWNRAKKSVKKYWNKYDEPWAVVYDVYRKMGGKPQKKKKKKS